SAPWATVAARARLPRKAKGQGPGDGRGARHDAPPGSPQRDAIAAARSLGNTPCAADRVGLPAEHAPTSRMNLQGRPACGFGTAVAIQRVRSVLPKRRFDRTERADIRRNAPGT